MFRLIFEKELRDIISSMKFAVTFAVCSVLILLTFYVGAQTYQSNVQRYEAAQSENIRKMQGLTDWLMVTDHNIFLRPRPLEALVTGISNDIGRNIQVSGAGDLNADDSRYNSDPIFAVFRFLDLDFIFQMVLSLFAILLGYDAVSGEKERGTLRLSFANAIPRDKFILAKIAGAFTAISIPLLIPILTGFLILLVMRIPLTGGEWGQLALVVAAGLMYFGVFLTLSIFISIRAKKSSTSFLVLLVLWIFAVLIIPRTAVLIAGRAVDVPTVDELASQKNRLRMQLWDEDRRKMASFQPSTQDVDKMSEEFEQFMQTLADNRNQQLQALSNRLNEDRRNRQTQQQNWALGLARISPAAQFSLAANDLAGTSLRLKQEFISQALAYQERFGKFMKGKTGINLGGGMRFMRVREDNSGEEEKPIDPHELTRFAFRGDAFTEALGAALPDLGLLILFNFVFFIAAVTSFLRYDLR